MATADEPKKTPGDHARAAARFALTACAENTLPADAAKAVVAAEAEAKKAREAANALRAGAEQKTALEKADQADKAVATAKECAKTKGAPDPGLTATQSTSTSSTRPEWTPQSGSASTADPKQEKSS
jgi:hypothetical protein